MSSCLLFAVLALLCARLPPAAYSVQLAQEEHTDGGDAVSGEERDGIGGGQVQIQDGHTTQPQQHEEGATMTTTMGDHGLTTADHTWPNKTIYFVLAQSLDSNTRAVLVEAMDEWSTHTCLEFRFAYSPDQDHLVFVKDELVGCSSYVGRVGGGAQIVSLATSCISKGHAMHLIGLAIGLFRESSRPDRDDFIKVLYKNIPEREIGEFEKLDDETFQLVPDVGYDIESIMHLGPFEHSRNGKRTIRVRNSAPLSYKHCTNLLEMGQRKELSYLDKLRTNKLYSCTLHILALEGVGRECVHHPVSSHRLKSGSAITLLVGDATAGVSCSPYCRVRRCQESSAPCHALNYQFEVIAVDREATKITSGSKVALRSKVNSEKRMDCGSVGNTCFISRCGNHDNQTSPCAYHHFTIVAVGRREGRLINSSHQIRLVRGGSALTCSYDRCWLSNGGKLTEREEDTFGFSILS